MLDGTVSSAVPSSIWALMSSWLTPTVLFLFLNIMIGTIAITSSLASQKPNNNHNEHPQQQHHHQDDDANNNNNNHKQQQIWRSPSVLQRLKSINLYSYRSQEPQIPSLSFEKPAPAAQELDHHHHHHHTSYFTSYFQSPEQIHTPPHQQHQPQQLTRSPSVLQRLKSLNPYNYIPYAQDSSPPAPQRQQQQHQHHHHLEEERREITQMEEDGAAEETLDEIYNKLQSSHRTVVGRSMSDTKPVAGEIPKKLPKKMKKSASTKSAFGHFEEEKIVEARRPATVREAKSKKLIEEEEEDAEGGEDAGGGVDAKADDFINKFKAQLKLQRLDSIIRYKEMVGRGSSAK